MWEYVGSKINLNAIYCKCENVGKMYVNIHVPHNLCVYIVGLLLISCLVIVEIKILK
jgi:hypothetical protein